MGGGIRTILPPFLGVAFNKKMFSKFSEWIATEGAKLHGLHIRAGGFDCGEELKQIKVRV